MPNFPKEASADLRQFAAQFRAMYLALVEEGFSEQQALAIIGQVIAAGIANAD